MARLRNVLDISAIEAFESRACANVSLRSIKPLTLPFVNMPEWALKNATAKELETWSLLGPCIRVTTLPDDPRVPDQYDPEIDSRRIGNWLTEGQLL